MKYLVAVAVGAMSFGTAGCQNASNDKALEIQQDMLKEMKAMNAKLDRVGSASAAGAQGQRGRPPQRRRGPEPGKRYAINIDGMPMKGNKNAPVTIVKAFEYACPACYHAQKFTDQVVKEFGDRVRIVYKDFVVHPTRAWEQAFAACAANKQGKWKEMEQAIWEKGFRKGKFDRAHYEGLAKEMGLNMAKFKKDYDGVCNQLTRASHAEMQGVGVAGTPTFFVNGKVLERRSLAEVKKMVEEVEEEWKKNGKKSGDAFYKQTVIAKGAKPRKVPLPNVPKQPPPAPKAPAKPAAEKGK